MQADNPCNMIISDEQVRRALRHLQTTDESSGDPSTRRDRFEVSDEFVRRIQSALADTPDVREDRVARAIEAIGKPPVSSEEVAAKIIARAISDSLR